jgi:ABC-type Fe3+/spermidine/putrescine transport system ATPase subunit
MDAIRVRVDGVSKRFAHRVKGEVYAARDVTLDVAPGEFLTLLGPSGCGKTTTLRMIAGFEAPDEGRIRFGDEDVTHAPADKRNIGFVFRTTRCSRTCRWRRTSRTALRVRGVAKPSSRTRCATC